MDKGTRRLLWACFALTLVSILGSAAMAVHSLGMEARCIAANRATADKVELLADRMEAGAVALDMRRIAQELRDLADRLRELRGESGALAK